jgi:hypothetical protein
MTPTGLRRRLRRGTIKKIRVALGKDASTVSHVIAGRIRSEKIENAIAQRVGLRRDYIFPLRRENDEEIGSSVYRFRGFCPICGSAQPRVVRAEAIGDRFERCTGHLGPQPVEDPAGGVHREARPGTA